MDDCVVETNKHIKAIAVLIWLVFLAMALGFIMELFGHWSLKFTLSIEGICTVLLIIFFIVFFIQNYCQIGTTNQE